MRVPSWLRHHSILSFWVKSLTATLHTPFASRTNTMNLCETGWFWLTMRWKLNPIENFIDHDSFANLLTLFNEAHTKWNEMQNFLYNYSRFISQCGFHLNFSSDLNSSLFFWDRKWELVRILARLQSEHSAGIFYLACIILSLK